MTVGSLRTMPRPRAYTRVLAVPRSMARSLARPALPLVVLGRLRRQRLQLTREVAHPGLHRVRLAAAQPQDQRADQAQQYGDAEVEKVRHDATSPAWTTSWAASLHSAPPAQLSRFHIGTVAFSASMQNRAASNASERWGADTATTTEHSATSSSPIRCSSATRPISGTRARPLAAMAARRGTTCSSYASYSRPVTPARPSAWSRTVPANTTTAPQSARTAHPYATSTDSGSDVSASQSSPSLGTCNATQ